MSPTSGLVGGVLKAKKMMFYVPFVGLLKVSQRWVGASSINVCLNCYLSTERAALPRLFFQWSLLLGWLYAPSRFTTLPRTGADLRFFICSEGVDNNFFLENLQLTSYLICHVDTLVVCCPIHLGLDSF